MQTSALNIPNALSCSRLLLVPPLLYLAYHQQHQVFLILLLCSICTDALDGYLARRWNQTSPLGAKLDSWGDFFTYGTMAVALYLAWPGIFSREFWFLSLGLGCYLVPTITALLKFHHFPRYHTWAAKLAAIMMLPAYFALVLWDWSSLFRGVILFHIWVALEELIITFILNKEHYNVPTLFHARELMRRQRQKLRDRREQRRN